MRDVLFRALAPFVLASWLQLVRLLRWPGSRHPGERLRLEVRGGEVTFTGIDASRPRTDFERRLEVMLRDMQLERAVLRCVIEEGRWKLQVVLGQLSASQRRRIRDWLEAFHEDGRIVRERPPDTLREALPRLIRFASSGGVRRPPRAATTRSLRRRA